MKGSKKFWFITVAFAGVAAFLFYQFINDLQTRYEPKDVRKVVVAMQAIEQDSIITPDSVTIEKVPAQYVHPKAFTDKSQVVGQIAVSDIAKGEQVLDDRILNKTNRKGQMAYVIPKGMRAISIAVDEISGVSGYVKPDDRVDILATVDIPVVGADGRDISKTYTVMNLQDILVLAVGNSLALSLDKEKSNKDSVETRTITLAVQPQEGQMLALAAERGSVKLMLRPPAERDKKKLAPVELKTLLTAGGTTAAPVKK